MRIFVFAGSLRKDSVNKKLAGLISQKLEGLGAEVDFADFREFEMPLYDNDIEQSDGLPAGAQGLADRISASDAFVIVTPEYNHSIPGPLKNAIDWISRIRPYPTAGKICFLASAAPSMVGGSRAVIALRPVLSPMGAWLSGDSFSLAQANQAFDDNGGLANADIEKLLDGMLDRFVKVSASAQTS
ncbi:MAG: NADPH-dependent FMN reductase [Rhodospirillaceae bacterium]|nr:NADPH-dependent FMN reductase [Rhodospirillaceae bacterium]|tara:strand:+ start:10849 stop:11406 length:558 start_codon:yes stop_codon:yes gene_type:complete